MRLTVIILILSAIIAPSAGFAMTLDQAVEYARQNAEDIRIVQGQAQETRATGRQASAFAKPQLGLSGGFQKIWTNAEELPAPFNQYFGTPDHNWTASVTGTQLLFAGKRIWNSLDLEKNLYLQADLGETSGVRDVVANVRDAFDAVLYRRRNLKILSDRVDQYQTQYQDASDLFDAGVVTALDVRQSKQALNAARDAQRGGKNDYQTACIDFNLAIGRPGDGDLEIPEGDLMKTPSIKDLVARLEKALEEESFLDIEDAKARVEGARLSHEIAGGAFWPSLAFVTTGKTEGEDSLDETWTVGAELSFDLFDGGARSAEKSAAGARLLQARQGLQKTRKELAGAVERLKLSFQAVAERIDIQKETAELARQNYEDAREQYRAGVITITQLGDYNLYYAEARFGLASLYFVNRQLVTRALALLEKENPGASASSKTAKDEEMSKDS